MTDSNVNRKVRVFFALWPSAAERKALAAWQVELQRLCGGRVMNPEGLHVTLIFLGDVSVDRLEALQLAAQEVDFSAFSIMLDVAHYWGHNHIVFAAPSHVAPVLPELVSKLEQSLLRHHFKFDARVFKTHVTLLRKARWSDTPLPLMPAVVWQVHDFVLVQSIGDERGSRYEVMARFPPG